MIPGDEEDDRSHPPIALVVLMLLLKRLWDLPRAPPGAVVIPGDAEEDRSHPPIALVVLMLLSIHHSGCCSRFPCWLSLLWEERSQMSPLV